MLSRLRIPSVRGYIRGHIARLKLQTEAYIWRQIASRLPWESDVSYSQFGEDMIVRWLTRGSKPGFYVDIGAFHPIALSNTYGLYCRGWRGINVEPRPGAVRKFDILRPRDINLGYCIVPTKKQRATYYMFEKRVYNTIDLETAQRYMNAGIRLMGKQPIPACTLTELLDTYVPENTEIDLMNIDVEGVDEDILRSNDWHRHAPKILIFEKHGVLLNNLHELPIIKYLDDLGYEFISTCGFSLILQHRQ